MATRNHVFLRIFIADKCVCYGRSAIDRGIKIVTGTLPVIVIVILQYYYSATTDIHTYRNTPYT